MYLKRMNLKRPFSAHQRGWKKDRKKLFEGERGKLARDPTV